MELHQTLAQVQPINMELYQTLAQIQKELNVPKSHRNEFSGFNYRSQEDILKAAKEHLPEGVTLTLSDEIVEMGERFYVKATATLTDGNTTITNTAYAREAESKKGMDPAQVTGATSSYARKYALNGLFAIDDTADPDTQDNTQGKNQNTKTDDDEL